MNALNEKSKNNFTVEGTERNKMLRWVGELHGKFLMEMLGEFR